MRRPVRLALAGLVGIAVAAPVAVSAADFDTYGAAPAQFVPIDPRPDVILEIGGGIGAKPLYEGASEYGAVFLPLIKVERLNIPGLIDIGGDPKTGGFSFAPSFDYIEKRVSNDHDALVGLDDVDATFALGARVGYEMQLTETLSGEVYGALRYGFGGAEGFVGDIGANLTARLTPQFELVGGAVVNLASNGYMDTYLGVTEAESINTGGRLAAYDPDGGIKSVGLNLAARYEFVPDTILTVKGSYSRYVGDALDSPIVQTGSDHQFTVGVGLSRRFSITY